MIQRISFSPARSLRQRTFHLAAMLLALTASAAGCNCSKTQQDLCATVVCKASDACHVAGVCAPATGKCTDPAAPDDTSCADADLCNGAEVCKAGVCVAKAGTAVVCNAPAACHGATGATCAPATGKCTYPNLADNTSCADADLCNGAEVCTAGVCAAKAGTAVTCNAPGACHTAAGATCNPSTGACAYPNAADDTSCADANLCNGAEVCKAGVCAAKPGTEVLCNAPGKCHSATGATCAPSTGACSYPNAADNTSCADADLCNGDEVCTAGVCGAKAGTAVTCNQPTACQLADGATCDPQTGSCAYQALADGTTCNGSGECLVAFSCQKGACACVVSQAGVRVLVPGGGPVAGAQVTSGDNTVPTDESGVATLYLTPGKRTLLQVSAAGYTDHTVVLTAPPAASFESVVYLLPRAPARNIDISVGLNAHYSYNYTADGLFRDAVLDIPSGALVDPTGGGVIVQMTLTPLDPTIGQREAAPGPFEGEDDQSKPVALLPLSLVEVVFTKDGTTPVQFAPEASGLLHLTLPAMVQGVAVEMDSLAFFLFDPLAGRWLESTKPGLAYNSNTRDSASWGATGRSVLEVRASFASSGWYMVASKVAGKSCARLQVVRASDGKVVANSGVHVEGVDQPGGAAGLTGPKGEPACIEFKRGGAAIAVTDDPWLSSRTSQAPIPLSGASAGACGDTAAACPLVQIQVADVTCVNGVAKLSDLTPAADALISATAGYGLGARTTRVTTGADGSYCVPAPTDTSVRLSLTLSGEIRATTTLTTGSSAAVCGGACTGAPDLVAGDRPVGVCVKGRLWDFQEGGRPRLPVASGTPVYLFTPGLEGSINVSCPDVGPSTPPEQWAQGGAQLLATAVTGADGRFCGALMPLVVQTIAPGPQPRAPLVLASTRLVVVPGDCALRKRSISDELSRGRCGIDDLSIQNDPNLACELENCIDLGDFDFGYLYDGSGCHRGQY